MSKNKFDKESRMSVILVVKSLEKRIHQAMLELLHEADGVKYMEELQ